MTDKKENLENENLKNETPSDAQQAKTESAENKKSDLELAQEEASKWKNDYLYLRAEFDTYKRNALKERSDLLKFGSERICRDLLEVVDNFERALEQKPKSADELSAFSQGIELIAKDFKEMLNKHGIQEIESTGVQFNPLYHEALSTEETTSVPDGHISRVFKKPYKLHDKVIRMGQVVVATPPKTVN